MKQENNISERLRKLCRLWSPYKIWDISCNKNSEIFSVGIFVAPCNWLNFIRVHTFPLWMIHKDHILEYSSCLLINRLFFLIYFFRDKLLFWNRMDLMGHIHEIYSQVCHTWTIWLGAIFFSVCFICKTDFFASKC